MLLRPKRLSSGARYSVRTLPGPRPMPSTVESTHVAPASTAASVLESA